MQIVNNNIQLLKGFILISALVTKHTSTLVTGDKQRKVLEPEVVENVVLLAETLSYVAVLLGAAHRLLIPFRMSFAKKGKKKRASGSQVN